MFRGKISPKETPQNLLGNFEQKLCEPEKAPLKGETGRIVKNLVLRS